MSGIKNNFCSTCAEYTRKELRLDDDFALMEYEDKGLRGYFSDRPYFQRMLRDVQDGKIRAIVCYKLDRVGRKTTDLLRLTDFLEKYNADLLICSNGINTASGFSKIFIQIFAVIAEFERDPLTEHITDNMMELAKDGCWLGGNTPMEFTAQQIDAVTIISLTMREMCSVICLILMVSTYYLRITKLTKRSLRTATALLFLQAGLSANG